MNNSAFVDSPMSDAERRQRLYTGDFFLFSPTDASRGLIGLASEMLTSAFAPFDPKEIHKYKTPEEVGGILAKVKPAFIHDPECERLIPRIMAEHGVELEKLYWDVPFVRRPTHPTS